MYSFSLFVSKIRLGFLSWKTIRLIFILVRHSSPQSPYLYFSFYIRIFFSLFASIIKLSYISFLNSSFYLPTNSFLDIPSSPIFPSLSSQQSTPFPSPSFQVQSNPNHHLHLRTIDQFQKKI